MILEMCKLLSKNKWEKSKCNLQPKTIWVRR